MEREDREPRRHRDNVQPRHSSTNSEEAGEEEQRDTATTDPSSEEQRGSRIFAPLALIDDENLDISFGSSTSGRMVSKLDPSFRSALMDNLVSDNTVI